MIYKSEVMKQLNRTLERVAPSNATVMILGEVGSGQTLLAQRVHELSNRKLKPFVRLNCGALRETLLESELFGHERGAFTGAYSRKIGLMEVANGGTLYLKEVDQFSPGIQAKLLRFLQEGEIYRIGGQDPIRVDVRIITSTTKDLDKEVLRGNFREDLFYSLNTIMIHSPPLRRRREDIEPLVLHFLNKGSVPFTRDVIKALEGYDWPGNVQELKNTVERLNVLKQIDTITISDLPDHIVNPGKVDFQEPYDSGVTLHELEKRYIFKALNHFNGDKAQAAEALGITIKTLYNKLHEYGD